MSFRKEIKDMSNKELIKESESAVVIQIIKGFGM